MSEEDRWTKLIVEEIPAEKKRLHALQDPTVQTLHTEMYGTVMDLLQDVGRMVLELGNSSGKWLEGLTAHVEDVDNRLAAIENVFESDRTQISPEHAEKLLSLAVGSAEAMKWLLSNAQGLETDAKKRFEEHIVLAEECAVIIQTHTIGPDEDDDEGGEDGDDSEDAGGDDA